MRTGSISVSSRVAAFLYAFILAAALVPFSSIQAFAAETESAEYELYPTPHSVVYDGDTVSLERKASLVVEYGIDADTVRRLDETLALQALPGISSDVISSKPGLSVLVGVKGSGGLVDKHAEELVKSKKLAYSDDLFTKTDAYVLSVIKDAHGAGEGVDEIIVLGKDTDAAFYGLTSLYRIFQQINNSRVQTLTIADYADVQTRGFIEGYYGNPWSTQNRVDLMTWGGYNKLNAYFYAPKDDPKHNAQWSELYSAEELESKIAPLAKAGNESKVRFIYAVHPFMNNPITNGNYDERVAKLKAKFTQVIDRGVRQIAILADDAADQGSGLYTRLLEDMTAWIHSMQNQKNADGTLKYPGLKDTIVFCPVNYMGNGESWYDDLPENVSVINTGGRVWGAASHSFFTQFKNNSGGRAAFMWMNFPCSDNDKDALHMANYENFLEPGVQPGDLTGLVMNPMQQSEPSKVAIFLNADYSWNLWTSAEHGDHVWDDAFAYAEHNSPIITEASAAMRTISQHMRRMYGGGATWEGRESAEAKDTLVALQNAIRSGNPTVDQVAAVKKVYTDIKPAVETFRAHAATPEMVRQMEPWLGAFNDLIDAAAFYSDAMSAYLQGDNDAMINNFQVAEGKISSYNKNHGFRYVDHDEFAKVGKAYLMPTVAAMQTYLDPKVKMALNPDARFSKFITNRTDTPEGAVSSVFDGDPSTGVTYKTPNSITAGTYAGVVSNKPFDADKVTFVLGDASGKDWFDAATLQYTTDSDAFSAPASVQWKDVPSAAGLTSSPVTVSDMNLTAITGLRLIATQDNSRDAWFVVKEITVGDPVVSEKDNPVMEGAVASASVGTYGSYSPAKGIDGDMATNYWSNANTTQDTVYTVTFDGTKSIKHVLLVQGSADKLDAGVVEYTADGGATWEKVADVATGTIAAQTST